MIIATGTPEDIVEVKESHTGAFLGRVLELPAMSESTSSA
jgi:excinuclease UvrABC ATPase subunit